MFGSPASRQAIKQSRGKDAGKKASKQTKTSTRTTRNQQITKNNRNERQKTTISNVRGKLDTYNKDKRNISNKETTKKSINSKILT